MRSTKLSLLAVATVLVAGHSAQAQIIPRDWIIQTGQTFVYDTSDGAIVVNRLIIQPAATLRIVGPNAFSLLASTEVRVEGTFDISGFDSHGVVTINTTNIPEPGAPGNASGGGGGLGSGRTTITTVAGGPGQGVAGGRGGEGAFALAPDFNRRGAGGAGGALAANQPVTANPDDLINLGLIANPGRDGSATATGLVFGQMPPRGGMPRASVFTDSDPFNDFWGGKLDPQTGLITIGELTAPVAGSGGGAGGDSVGNMTLPFDPTGDEKGSGGGGGAGLAMILTRTFTLTAGAKIIANGGDGGGGENTMFFNRIGGGSGAGSGGFLVLEARVFDLSQADPHSIQALGGRGGPGENNQHDADGAGGNGGPGLIQLHTSLGPAGVLLPAGMSLAGISTPAAHLLTPVLGN